MTGLTRYFVASAMPTTYPYKLQKPSTISKRVRDTADVFILDSGIGDDVSNHRVIELAERYEPDYVVAKDYLHDQPRTTASVREFMDLYEDLDVDATPMVPLQPPFDEHYHDLDGFSHYVLGGMAGRDVDTAEQYRLIRDFRGVAPDVYAHGLGVGGGIGFIQRVAGTGLLDSCDSAAPEMAAQYGAVMDQRLRQQQVRVMSGEGASRRNILLGSFNSFQVMDVWEREARCGGLSAWMDP